MRKFKVAINGLKTAFRHKAVLLQLSLAIVAIVFFLILGIDDYQWSLVFICIGMVLSAEIFNTCIERLCDHISPKSNKQIGLIKDMAAGAVLITALASLIVAVFIIARRLF